jgi:Family of unknown function (DUF5360)
MTMPRALRVNMLIVDFGMLLYWGVAALALAGIINLPASLMYNGYGTPMIDAWNWSFAPIDLLFAVTGLVSVRLSRRDGDRWLGWALVSITLTGCAGLMAVSFWALTGDFDPAWWLPNLVLVAIAVFWVPRLLMVPR